MHELLEFDLLVSKGSGSRSSALQRSSEQKQAVPTPEDMNSLTSGKSGPMYSSTYISPSTQPLTPSTWKTQFLEKSSVGPIPDNLIDKRRDWRLYPGLHTTSMANFIHQNHNVSKLLDYIHSKLLSSWHLQLSSFLLESLNMTRDLNTFHRAVARSFHRQTPQTKFSVIFHEHRPVCIFLLNPIIILYAVWYLKFNWTPNLVLKLSFFWHFLQFVTFISVICDILMYSFHLFQFLTIEIFMHLDNYLPVTSAVMLMKPQINPSSQVVTFKVSIGREHSSSPKHI